MGSLGDITPGTRKIIQKVEADADSQIDFAAYALSMIGISFSVYY